MIGFGVLYFTEGKDANAQFAELVDDSIDWDYYLSAFTEDADGNVVTMHFVKTGIGFLMIVGIVAWVAGILVIVGLKISVLSLIAGVLTGVCGLIMKKYADVLAGIEDLGLGVKIAFIAAAAFIVLGLLRWLCKKPAQTSEEK